MIQAIFLALGLAMDSFAVSVAVGAASRKLVFQKILNAAMLAGLFFGFFQAIMPYLGWLLGSGAHSFVSSIDHWIAFAILAAIGGKMFWTALTEKEESSKQRVPSVKKFFLLAVATSIDAFSAGIGLAFTNWSIITTAIIVGVITAALSFLGVFAGKTFGGYLKRYAQALGGIILVAIGAQILFTHLFG